MQTVAQETTQEIMQEVGLPAEQSESELLDAIIGGELIQPVYQPIASLEDGQVYGYEALSRITCETPGVDIEQLFRMADRSNRLWELESLCRVRALEGALGLRPGAKLFLNVNPNVLNDQRFIEGFKKHYLEKVGLDSENIVFEITERSAVIDNHAFLLSISHYKGQGYKIAIDDVGAGYSGLNALSVVKPNLIKLDMHLIRNIDKDETKQLICKAMVDFAKGSGIGIVAEGVETEEELATLIRLQVDYGQGYFIGIPRRSFAAIAPEKVEAIQRHHGKKYSEKARGSVYPIIGHLSKPGYCFSPSEKTERVYEKMRLNPTITEFAIVEDGTAIGFMTKSTLNAKLGGRHGFDLFSRKQIADLMESDFLRANHSMTVDHVSRLAMQRPFERLYDPIVVEKDGGYSGIVTIKDLLDACTKIEVDIAIHSNPLTGLPGNLLIEKEILGRLFGRGPYCIIYYDIDNFKAYNDAYGFQNGDLMLGMLAGILRKNAVRGEFIGHIGGDDFIVVCDYHEGEDFCRATIEEFSAQVLSLYRDEDIRNGYIVSKNRNGVTENFPIASLSVGGISNRESSYNNIADFSNDIAQIKKRCKQRAGNCFEIR